MELSEQTIGVLRNYFTINPNIVVGEGNNLKTISVAKKCFIITTVSENFPKEFGIYDLNEFLNVLTLVDKPHLTFEDDFVTVGDQTGRSG